MKTIYQILGAAVIVTSTFCVNGINSPTHADEALSLPNLNGFLAIQNSGRDFFEEGREKLEKEVKIIYRGELSFDEEILTISEDIAPPEQEEIRQTPDILNNPL